tara:strand:- start:2253 stop:3404 length:1152 start_codon:yes stop_codon:yes gene_type:complete
MAANGILDFQGTNQVNFMGAASNIVIDTLTASLGIGVDVNGPTSNLHVVGNAHVSTNLTIGGNIDFIGNLTNNGAAYGGGGGGGSSPWLQTTSGVPADGIYFTAGNVAVDTNTFFVDSTNNRVGIGTTTPGSTLDVVGTVTSTAFVGPITGDVTGNATTATRWDTGRTIVVTGGVTGTTSAFDGSGNATLTTTLENLSAAKITSGTLPVARGGTGTTTSTGTGSVVLSIAPTFSGNVTVDTNTLFVDSVNDRVGIGTITPLHKLDVAGDIRFTGDIYKGNVLQSLGGAFLTNGVAPNRKAYYTDGPVGIANVSALTTQTLQIGANVVVNDTASDKLVVTGSMYLSKNLKVVDEIFAYKITAAEFEQKDVVIVANQPPTARIMN